MHGYNYTEAFLQVKKLMEKTYSETEQNMSEKQGKGQIMLHLPMKFENHVMNRENEFLNISYLFTGEHLTYSV
jgi:hypothetical protein